MQKLHLYLSTQTIHPDYISTNLYWSKEKNKKTRKKEGRRWYLQLYYTYLVSDIGFSRRWRLSSHNPYLITNQSISAQERRRLPLNHSFASLINVSTEKEKKKETFSQSKRERARRLFWGMDNDAFYISLEIEMLWILCVCGERSAKVWAKLRRCWLHASLHVTTKF